MHRAMLQQNQQDKSNNQWNVKLFLNMVLVTTFKIGDKGCGTPNVG